MARIVKAGSDAGTEQEIGERVETAVRGVVAALWVERYRKAWR
ncbi:MAG: hypothetical protein OXH85_09490 [Truepera sp.]|nr:hypothetical protein [Truepera sp.]